MVLKEFLFWFCDS